MFSATFAGGDLRSLWRSPSLTYIKALPVKCPRYVRMQCCRLYLRVFATGAGNLARAEPRLVAHLNGPWPYAPRSARPGSKLVDPPRDAVAQIS